ncbi:GNAT family N-acetyltransferase [Peptoniphilus sp. BV3AC2]|uniref:GNAT family N-acetyltransferase n=1 Tax=Peptoniphilus sp. BV3AC2 TaxID=1111133 RepID=UPI0003B8B457|nr:GNAT family N-acetyltransferase [Peptoniphilus sp. BV3AC2]ERT63654.1 acetyltransferase (GNAT) domain protein [Peptoniphilus sp. BV3AC2]
MIFRKASASDIDAIERIYYQIHLAEKNGEANVGWEMGVYPVRKTAEYALKREDLFVLEDDGFIIGSGIINRNQVDVYANANWKYKADPSEVMVFHTLVIDPNKKGKGYGRAFMKFYEEYALQNNCKYLRIDTNEKNKIARNLYKSLGYEEIGMIPCTFNGVEGVNLVLIEKYLKNNI